MSSRRLLAVGLLVSSGCGLVLEAPRRDADTDASADAAPADDAPAPPDLDAATLDAASSALDAARLDASLPDASLPDASLPDASMSMLDARMPDAPMLDAFAPDARMPDALTPDAFVRPDAFMPPDELIAHYPFHGVDDMTGRGHTLSIASLAFTGRVATFTTGSTASTPDAVDLDEVQAISVWVRPGFLPAGTARATLVDSQGRYAVRISGTSLLCAHGGGLEVSGTALLEVGSWRFVACSFTASAAVAFIGGVGTFSGSAGSPPPPRDARLVLGRNVLGEQVFVGDLSDVRIWRRAPTIAELESLAATAP